MRYESVGNMPYTLPDWEREIEKCSMCGKCHYVCPVWCITLNEAVSARGHLQLIGEFMGDSGSLADAGPSATFRDYLDCCLRCYRCLVICPSDVRTVPVFETGKVEVGRRGGIPLALKLTFRYVWPSKRLMNFFAWAGATAERIVAAVLPFLAVRAKTASGLGGSRFLKLGKYVLPMLAPASFSSRIRRIREAVAKMPPYSRNGKPDNRLKVVYLPDCMMDYLYPSVPESVLDVLTRMGVEVIIPPTVSCCGAPPLGSGDIAAFKKMAEHNLKVWGALDFDYLVFSNATCAKTVKFVYPEVFGERAKGIAAKVRMDFDIIREIAPDIAGKFDGKVSFHDPCHLKYAMRITDAPRRLLASVADYEEVPTADQCCGFGGTFCVTHPVLAQEINAERIGQLARVDADIVATECPACMAYLGMGMERAGAGKAVVHVMEVVRAALDGKR